MRAHDRVEVEVRPCPCCGSRSLWVGVTSSQSHGVECRRCRLMVSRSTPSRWPPRLYKSNLSWDVNHRNLVLWVLNKAIEAWNKRPKVAGATFKEIAHISS